MLPHVEIELGENIFKTLIIGVDVAMITKKVVAPYV
jgi:hypothetical protein